MKICIVGAGAIGGLMGARLALAGEDVTLIARGAHLTAIQQNGLKLLSKDGPEQTVTNVRATADMSEAGPQDAVIVALKAHSLPGVAPAIRSLYKADTLVVAAQNGVPWWYFKDLNGPYRDYRIRAVDPDGLIEQNIEIRRVIGCVVYPAAEIPQPGVVRHLEGDRFSLGEPDGSKSERLRNLAQTFNKAGLKAPIRGNIRTELWVKLWGNLAFNPISALTRALLSDITAYPLTRELARRMMTEAQEVATKLGIDFGIGLEQRIEGVAGVGAHKTSMLQDIESGRPTEIDAILGAVAELGRLTGVPTPNIDALYACVKLLEKSSQWSVASKKAGNSGYELLNG